MGGEDACFDAGKRFILNELQEFLKSEGMIVLGDGSYTGYSCARVDEWIREKLE